ncbi:LptF/LptG family permease [uncultured Dokdonia sp.]|uniref:LptF/LptG family permease n=1 Tax=uncultured Dokdonia sp. TaxID=575653 RepID=UPI00263256AF|nr:LptF/LptG family permease [uncultured Dokdonia sp.]
MKILDRYILFTFVKTFLSIFIILMFIFVLQSVWLYIQELAGRDLDFSVILKFLLFVTPSLVTLVLPLSVLLTSIMTFGNFAENYEFAAMKSTGISLQRAMKSLIVFIVFLGITSFLFANYVIPASQFEFRNLRNNIGKLKPAMIIRSGQFNAIGEEINIRVANKYGDRDQYLEDVIIHKKEPGRVGNFTVIKAKEGELISSLESPILSLKLTDGNYYNEVKQTDYKKQKREPFAKSYFETYTLNIDLGVLNGGVDLDKKGIDNSYQMLNVQELDSSLTGLAIKYDKSRKDFGQTFVRKANFKPVKDFKLPVEDTIQEVLLDNYNLTDKVAILQTVKSSIGNAITSIERRKKIHAVDVKRLNKFEIAIHEKYVLGFSCIVLFFVGAPLGAIIRKGGLGLPIVVGVVLFLTFHFIGIFAKNSAEDGTLSAFTASWLSTFITLPIGVYLTYRATTDQGLIDLDPVRLLLQKIFGKKKKEKEVIEEKIEYTLTEEEVALLDARSINQLKEIVKNYKQYNYSEALRYGALDRLDALGITKENLKVQGFYENKEYNDAERYYNAYKKYSIVTFIFYGLALLSLIISFTPLLFKTFSGFLTREIALLVNIFSSLIYVVFYYISINSFRKIYKSMGKVKEGANAFLVAEILGIPFYLITYFYFKKKIKEDMNTLE